MPMLCRSYPTHDNAQAAVDRLLASGIAEGEIRVLEGLPERDQRDAPVGRFGGPDAGAGGDPVGSFAGAPGSTRDAMGAFAGPHGEPRRGGFGDLDRDTITTYADGVARVDVAGHRDLRSKLIEAGLPEASRRGRRPGAPPRPRARAGAHRRGRLAGRATRTRRMRGGGAPSAG